MATGRVLLTTLSIYNNVNECDATFPLFKKKIHMFFKLGSTFSLAAFIMWTKGDSECLKLYRCYDNFLVSLCKLNQYEEMSNE